MKKAPRLAELFKGRVAGYDFFEEDSVSRKAMSSAVS